MRTTVSRWTCVAAVAAAFTATSLTGCYSGGGWSMPRLSSLNPMNWGRSSDGSSLVQNGPEYPPSPNVNAAPSQPGGQLAGGSAYGTTGSQGHSYGTTPSYPNSGAPGYPNSQPPSAFNNGTPSYAGGAQNGFYTADQRNATGYGAPPTGNYPAPSGGGSGYGTSGYGAPNAPSGGAPTYPYAPPTGGASPAPSGGYGYPGGSSSPSYPGGGSDGYGAGSYDTGSYGGGSNDAGSNSYDGGAYGGGSSDSSYYGGSSYDGGTSGEYQPSGSTPAPGFGSNDTGAPSGAYSSNDSNDTNLSMPGSLMQREGSYSPGSVSRTQLANASSGSPTTFNRAESGDSPADLPSSGGYDGESSPQPGYPLPNRY